MERDGLKMGQTSEWETLPLFHDLPMFNPVYRSIDDYPFEDPFLMALNATTPIQRLKRIGFLGAIDYVRIGNGQQPHRRRHNRYDHSVGVTQLALRYSDIRELSTQERRVLAAAGLLHDIGHGPLSHTLEPIFKDSFGINHHKAGMDILRGHSPFGNEIPKVMSEFGIDLDEVASMIEGTHTGSNAYLFASPINLDTIEGITRSRSFVKRWDAGGDARHIVEEIALSNSLPTRILDNFWALKHEVYNLVIHNPWGLIFDGLAQAFMAHNIDSFKADDFMKTEEQLRHKQPVLFHIFAWAKVSKRRAYHRVSSLVPDLLEYELLAPQRSFEVDTSIQLDSVDALNKRYKQHKEHRMMTIGKLIQTEKRAVA